jgi:hypothetical protein
MSYSVDVDRYELVSAEEFLRQMPQRGRPLRLKHLDLTVYGIQDCLCFGDATTVVLPFQGESLRYIFRESCNYRANEFTLPHILAQCLAGNPEPLDIDEAASLCLPGMENLWHWMAEGLPKLLALESIGYTGKYIIADNAMIRQFMELLHIDPARLLPGKGTYRVQRLMLPQRLSGFDLVEYMPLTELMRDALLRAVGRLDGTKRLYVQRIGRRKPANEKEVLALLDEFGFTVMVPEDFSLKEQLRCMTNVTCSVMAHGANAALTLMQPPRSALIELFSNRYVSYNNLHTARLLRLRYHPLVEDLDVSSSPANDMLLSTFLESGFATDMLVDLRHLRTVLESILDTPEAKH